MNQSDRSTTVAASAVILFTVVLAALGLAALAAAWLPQAWLRQLAQSLGHAEDLTPERVLRLRIVGTGLAAAHLILAGLLGGPARAAAARVLARLGEELSPAGLPSLVDGRRWLRGQGATGLILLALVLVAGTAIRLRYLNVPIDYDEAYSFLNYARRPLYQGLADYHSTNNHLLNTFCMHVQYKLFGQREWALRLHVLAAGVALLAATYGLGRCLAGQPVGLLAAALVASSGLLVNYSVNARGYIWVALMTVWLIYASGRLEENGRIADWFAAAVAAVLGLFAIPIMLYPLAGCAGWLLVQSRRPERPPEFRAGLLAWVNAVSLVTLWLYAPALVFRGTAAWQHPFLSPLPWSEWLVRAPAAWYLAIRSGLDGPVPWWLLAVAGAVGAWWLWRPNRRSFWLLAAVPVGTFAVTLVQRVAPPPRIFTFMAPLLCILAAAGIVTVLRAVASGKQGESTAAERIGAVVLVCLCCAGGVWKAYWEPLPGGARPSFLIEDVGKIQPENQLWRLSIQDAVAALKPVLGRDDRVLVGLPADLPFHFYAARRGLPGVIGGEPQPTERLFLVIRPCEQPRAALEKNLSLGFTKSWILDAGWEKWRELEHLVIWQRRVELLNR